MIEDLLIVFFLVMASEAVTEIITDSELTNPLRMWWKRVLYPADTPPRSGWLQNIGVYIDKLVSCGHCTSVWVSAFFALFAPFATSFIMWVIMTFAIHRLTNWFHVVYELVRKGRVKTHDLLIKLAVEDQEDGIVGESEGEAE